MKIDTHEAVNFFSCLLRFISVMVLYSLVFGPDLVAPFAAFSICSIYEKIKQSKQDITEQHN